MKKKLYLLLLVSLLCAFTSTAQAAQAVQNVVMPGGSMGGSLYTAGTILADVINKNVPSVSFSARAGGTVENILILENKESVFAMSSGFDYYVAKNSQPRDSQVIRSITVLPYFIDALIVPKDSPVKSLYDLKGKAVNLADRRLGNYAMNLHILDVAGLKESDFAPQYLASSEGATALSEGKIAGSFFLTSVPAPSLVAIANSPKGGKVIPYGKELLDKLMAKYPFYFLSDLTDENAPGLGITTPIPVPTYWPELLVANDVPDELVYNITKAIYSNKKELEERWDAMKLTTPENAVKNTAFKIHPGAEKYYKEIGVLK